MSSRTDQPRFVIKEFSDRMPPTVQIYGLTKPVSLQTKGGRRSEYIRALRARVAESTEIVFMGDVRVDIAWTIGEDQRYRTHLVADIDNIVKPILDGLTGPDCILIDDNQVQSIFVSWTTPPMVNDAVVDIRIESLAPDSIARRKHIAFVELSKNICYPVVDISDEAVRLQISAIRNLLDGERQLVELGMPAQDARLLRPIQRPFPRARLQGFKILDSDDY